MKVKRKFVCQITSQEIQVVSWQFIKGKSAVVKIETESISENFNDSQISERLVNLFKKFKLDKDPIIISLPRILATCRCLKLPSKNSAEIEEMVRFHAGRFLPYSADELISGYSLIDQDKQGYSSVNLIIVHRNVVERLLGILKNWRNQVETVFLSSYALFYWYKTIKPVPVDETVMVMNIIAAYAELVIIKQDKVMFNRAFKLPEQKNKFSERLHEEIDKTIKSYIKEAFADQPKKIIFTGIDKELLDDIRNLDIGFPFEIIEGNPLVAAAGQKIPEELNLLPLDMKAKKRGAGLKRLYIKAVCFVLGIISFFSLGTGVIFYNKALLLEHFKQEVRTISPQVKVIEEMDKKIRIISSLVLKRPKAIEVFYEIYRLLPECVFLNAMVYIENTHVVLSGQARDLTVISDSVSVFEKIDFFTDVKLRYATAKKIQGNDVVDFEIICYVNSEVK